MKCLTVCLTVGLLATPAGAQPLWYSLQQEQAAIDQRFMAQNQEWAKLEQLRLQRESMALQRETLRRQRVR